MASLETLTGLTASQLRGRSRITLCKGLSEFPKELFELAETLEILEASDNCFERLPDEFATLHRLKAVFFNNNAFRTFPTVLKACPNLSVISFKGNHMAEIEEGVLSTAVRWLVMTNNQLTHLPADIGKLTKLQKLMLTGNQLTHLPAEMAACQRLALLRIAANRLTELPEWLLSLPRLAWLAYSENPCAEAAQREVLNRLSAAEKLRLISPEALAWGEVLGEGASGVIYQGCWRAPEESQGRAVALKVFKGEMTSDGSPQAEMQACIAAGAHPNLVEVLGRLETDVDGPMPHQPMADGADGVKAEGLVLSLIPPEYQNLGAPPSLDSCTRDTYAETASFSIPLILKMMQGIAGAIAHLHQRGLMHGDLYAHNILFNDVGESFLGDFGAASFYDAKAVESAHALERLEVRAFGCLLEDLLNRVALQQTAPLQPQKASVVARLWALQKDCVNTTTTQRPLFSAICERLVSIHEESCLPNEAP
ncbi:MAG: leucine-rich repeat-containing protein kinase family protein [Cyanobacteria bacterium J06634_5]